MHGIDAAAFVQVQFPALPQLDHRSLLPPEYIVTAIGKDPKNTLYYCEKASLEIRVNLFDDAIKTAGQCIAVDPKLGEGYMFLGLAQCLKGDKAAGRQNLQKAKDLGDTQAQELIDKYAN